MIATILTIAERNPKVNSVAYGRIALAANRKNFLHPRGILARQKNYLRAKIEILAGCGFWYSHVGACSDRMKVTGTENLKPASTETSPEEG